VSLIDLPTAKAHLRVDDDFPDELVDPYLRAAEIAAQEFLNRRVFSTAGDLAAAIAAVPAQMAAATAARDAALEVAGELEDATERADAIEFAEDVYRLARVRARETRYGIVLDELVQTGVLMIFGHLYENRQDVQAGVSAEEIPMGSKTFLWPRRIGLGV